MVVGVVAHEVMVDISTERERERKVKLLAGEYGRTGAGHDISLGESDKWPRNKERFIYWEKEPMVVQVDKAGPTSGAR